MILAPVITGLLVGSIILFSENTMENQRIANSILIEDARSDKSEQLENLRFVRERSSLEDIERPFENLDLRGTFLNGLNLRISNFRYANLEGTSFNYADLSPGDMETCPVKEEDRDNESKDEPRLTTVSTFLKANLKYSSWVQSKARCADFSEVELDGAYLHGDFRGAYFLSADLRGATFANSRLEDADFTDAFLEGAIIEGSDLSKTVGLPLNLPEISCFDQETVWPDYIHTDLEEPALENCGPGSKPRP